MSLPFTYYEQSCNIYRLQNEKEAETPPIASPTTSESMLCKKLQQFEDQLKEILAHNDISKKQTVKITNIKKITVTRLVKRILERNL